MIQFMFNLIPSLQASMFYCFGLYNVNDRTPLSCDSGYLYIMYATYAEIFVKRYHESLVRLPVPPVNPFNSIPNNREFLGSII